MARHHVEAYQALDGVAVAAAADPREEPLAEFAETWAIPSRYRDYREMLEAENLDGVSIVTPDASHAEISIACLERGIPVLCEKPMASTLQDADRMHAAWLKAGVPGMINYSKRNSAGLQKARELIATGEIGEIRHAEASYLQSWLTTTDWGDWRENPRLTWRLSTRHGSMGTLGDIGCHIYDMAAFLCGDITEIYCRLETYDKGIDRVGEYVLDANDSMAATVVFAGGVIGSIHSTRWAPGFRNREFVRVCGTRGTVEVDLDKSLDTCRLFLAGDEDWTTVTADPTPSNYQRFVTAVREGTTDPSDFANGLQVQKYLDASMRSAAERRPVVLA